MTIKETILLELNTISTLVASVPNVNVYKVHANYFDGIRSDLQANIIASNFETLKTKAEVPVGYFENLPLSIFAKIKQGFGDDEIKSTLLENIGNKNVYTIPQGYFEELEIALLPKAKIIKLSNFSIFKYAAAAAIIAGVAFGAFTFLQNKNTLANENASMAAVLKEANEILVNNTFDATLAKISDKDLENYLLQNGENVNTALLATTINDSNTALPEAIDYLEDENTLDDFLKNNNLNN